MIRIEISSHDEGSWTHQRMISARESLENLGEKVTLTYAESFTRTQRIILAVMFLSGAASGAMIALIACTHV